MDLFVDAGTNVREHLGESIAGNLAQLPWLLLKDGIARGDGVLEDIDGVSVLLCCVVCSPQRQHVGGCSWLPRFLGLDARTVSKSTRARGQRFMFARAQPRRTHTASTFGASCSGDFSAISFAMFEATGSRSSFTHAWAGLR